MQYLISIAIGPVQEFIATARRSRDLWFGSWLLSELSKAAAKSIVDQGGELIFPNTTIEDLKPATEFNVVNKITAIITIENNAVQKFSEAMLEAVKSRLKKLRDDAFGQYKEDEYFDREIANKQIEDLTEYYFAAVPMPDETKYPKIRQQAEALLTARKNTRNFISTKDWAQEAVPKSSLDGLRESVISEAAYKPGGLSVEERRQRYETRPGERLCGVGLLKRRGNWKEQEGFFSTSHVAAFPLLSNLQDAHTDIVKKYFNELRGINESAWSGVSGNDTSKIHKRIRKVFCKDFQHYCTLANFRYFSVIRSTLLRSFG